MPLDVNAIVGDEFLGSPGDLLQDHIATKGGKNWAKRAFGATQPTAIQPIIINSNNAASASTSQPSSLYILNQGVFEGAQVSPGGYFIQGKITFTSFLQSAENDFSLVAAVKARVGVSNSQTNRVVVDFERASDPTDRDRVVISTVHNGVVTQHSFIYVSDPGTQLGAGTYSFKMKIFGGPSDTDLVRVRVYIDDVQKLVHSFSSGLPWGWRYSHETGLALPHYNPSPGSGLLIDDWEVLPNLLTFNATDTLDTDLPTETGAQIVTVLQTGTDTLGVDLPTENGTLIKEATESGPETLGVALSAESASFIPTTDLLVRAGLISDIEPSLVQAYWPANNLLIPELIATASTSGYVLEGALNNVVIEHLDLEDSGFFGLMASHLASMFSSPGDQRGTQRIFVRAALLNGDLVAFRGVMKSPLGALPATQDPQSHASSAEGVYRHLDCGILTWPPALGGSDKIRSGLSSSRASGLNLDGSKGLEVQGISEGSVFPDIRLSALEILPVEDGFFALMGIKTSNESSIKSGTTLAMDKISRPTGGYSLKQSESKSTEKAINIVGSASLMAVLGDGLTLRPNTSNLISFIADGWNDMDDLGASGDSIQFEVAVDYEPRYLFF